MIEQGGIIPYLPKYAGDTLKWNQNWGKKCENLLLHNINNIYRCKYNLLYQLKSFINKNILKIP